MGYKSTPIDSFFSSSSTGNSFLFPAPFSLIAHISAKSRGWIRTKKIQKKFLVCNRCLFRNYCKMCAIYLCTILCIFLGGFVYMHTMKTPRGSTFYFAICFVNFFFFFTSLLLLEWYYKILGTNYVEYDIKSISNQANTYITRILKVHWNLHLLLQLRKANSFALCDVRADGQKKVLILLKFLFSWRDGQSLAQLFFCVIDVCFLRLLV